jgi:hypothetical protein
MPTAPVLTRLLNKYRVGDYVEYIDDVFGNKKIGKITEYLPNISVFKVELINGKAGDTSQKNITRKLTSDEIEKFELEKSINKYNL